MKDQPKPLAHVIEAAKGFVDDDGLALAGHLAFIGLMSLIPFLLFVITLAGFFGATESGTYFVAFIQENLPDEVAATFEPVLVEVFQEKQGGLLTVSLLSVLWLAGSGLEGIRAAIGRAYKSGERRPYWKRRLQGLGLVIVFSALFLAAAACLFFGPILWGTISDLLGLGPAADTVWSVARYGIGGLTMFAIACTLYYALPNVPPGWRGVVPGAAASLVLALAASALFSHYVELFGRYAVVYGSLGGVIVALIFFYLLGAIFVFGAELNAAVERRRAAR